MVEKVDETGMLRSVVLQGHLFSAEFAEALKCRRTTQIIKEDAFLS